MRSYKQLIILLGSACFLHSAAWAAEAQKLVPPAPAPQAKMLESVFVSTVSSGVSSGASSAPSAAATPQTTPPPPPAKAAPKRVFMGEKHIPIIYSRTNVLLLRKALPQTAPLPMPWQGGKENPGEAALILDVELRDGMGLYNQGGWFNLSSYSDRSGVLMAFREPVSKPIVRSAQYAATDILFINAQGTIAQIMPNILLSDLEQDVYPDAPVLAFLFLKGGSCAALSINVGDEVQHSMFKKPPVILSAPPAATPQLPPATGAAPPPSKRHTTRRTCARSG